MDINRVPETGGNVPDGHITAFDKHRYEQLTNYLHSTELDLNERVMIPTTPPIDFHDPQVRPGSKTWTPAGHLADQVKALSSSIFDRLDEVDKEYTKFGDAMVKAKKVFEDTNDLANYSAQAFTDKYPDFSGGPAATGGPASTGGANSGGGSTKS